MSDARLQTVLKTLAKTAEPRIRLPTEYTKIKVGIIGSGGKIGLRVLENILSHINDYSQISTLGLLNTQQKKIAGFLYDFSTAHNDMLHQIDSSSMRQVITTDFSDLANMDVLFILAGKFPSSEINNICTKEDSTNRFAQSIANYPLMVEFSENIKKYSPRALVFVISNQVDMMADVLRAALPDQRVIGIGGMVDTERFKFLLSHFLYQQKLLDAPNPEKISAHMVGYHNNNMCLLRNSLKINGKAPDWENPEMVSVIEKAVAATRSAGLDISGLQQDKKHPDVDSGSSQLPAMVVIKTMKAISNGTSLIAPFNILLSESEAAQYGVKHGSALSVPVAINGMHIKPIILPYAVTEAEKANFRDMQKQLQEDTVAMHTSIKRLNQTPKTDQPSIATALGVCGKFSADRSQVPQKNTHDSSSDITSNKRMMSKL